MNGDLSTFLNVVLGIATLTGAAIAVQQYLKARASDRRLREVEKAVTSYRYLKDRALDEYRNGRFRECFDIFQKYYAGNDDSSDLHDTINALFWAETRKIYGEYLGERTTLAILLFVQNYLSRSNEGKPTKSYPALVQWFLAFYKEKFNETLPYYWLPVRLAEGAFESALGYIDQYEASGGEFSKELASMLRVSCHENLARRKEPSGDQG